VSQEGVEIILLKQLASCLRIPIALIAPDGAARFFNEPAESIFGLRFEETGELSAEEWLALLQPSDVSRVPLKPEERPLTMALEHRVPGHRRLHIRSNSGRWSEIEITAIPMTAVSTTGKSDRFLGALSLFWEPGARLSSAGKATDTSGQQAVETILTRRIAARLTAPIFLVDADGRLLYFNPAAEPILGRRFSSAAPIASWEELYDEFQPRDGDGSPMAPEDHPLSIARAQREPVHRDSWIRGADGQDRRIAITAVPLVGQSDRLVGAFGVFWESGPS
jgi:PAS domain-containing protein